jgi:2-(1,2-epoxy-1,2-dihydrophenyl)acetyl-CoA isomerase
MGEFVETTTEGDLAVVALNRPKAYNAFHLDMMTDLAGCFTELATKDQVKAVIITGKGKAFCAGGDLKWVLQFGEKPGAAFHTMAAQFHHAVSEIRRMNKPVIAAVNGIAAGGGFSMALACDFRIMEKSAVLRQAYTANGLSIDGGGTFMLPRLVGYARAMEIAAFDTPINADKAYEWGLATCIAEDGESLADAKKMANQLANGSIHSFAWAKHLLNTAFSDTLETHLELEREGLADCADHPDGREGLTAFSEGRKPAFNKSKP